METMGSFLKYFWGKLLLSVPACFIAFSQSQTDIIYGIVYIIILDTILGIWVAVKYKIFASHQLARVFGKISRYTLALGSVWVISAVEPSVFSWLFRWTGIFIIITEILSNFEKLALLGFRIPGKILSKLNKQFLNFFDEKEKVEKGFLANDILRNRENCER